MQLTAELFQQIVKGLRSDERNATKHGKRKEGRVGVRYWADLMPPVGNHAGKNSAKVMDQRVMIRDLSPSGMGFTCHNKMSVGLEMVCWLPTLAGSTIEVPLKVQHCTQVAKDLYVVGTCLNPPSAPAGKAPLNSGEADPGITDLSQLLYTSDATAPMSSVELELLLETCRRKNNASHITGLLIYSAGHFMQLLEGPWPVVSTLLCKISQDARHHNVRQLYLGPSDERLFPKWEMELLNVDGTKGLVQSALLDGVDLLNRKPEPATILKVFGGFRSQLPANSDSPNIGQSPPVRRGRGE